MKYKLVTGETPAHLEERVNHFLKSVPETFPVNPVGSPQVLNHQHYGQAFTYEDGKQ